ncbi:hypothetical protein GE061_004916 [Apolygus lucorum]|uniref:Uncharacterized protein n=1 Tax=Apolygus lucorum TaxID=248454 RepID=A0A8S9WUU5_APOLU|nr:hypothetical protein GE061_004916 [Apolygus lucorum]
MPLEWTVWREKLMAVDFPHTASLKDEQAAFNSLFRPTPQRKKLIAWVARRIAEFNEDLRSPVCDPLTIFSNFMFGPKETFEAFVKGDLDRKTSEHIWIAILDDLKPRGTLCGDREARIKILLDGIETVSSEELEPFGVLALPPEDSSNSSATYFSEIDEVIKSTEAMLAQPLPVVTSSSQVTSTLSPEKNIRPLAKLKEDANKLSTELLSESSAEEIISRNEQIAQIRTSTADFEELLNELGTLKASLKKLDGISKK